MPTRGAAVPTRRAGPSRRQPGPPLFHRRPGHAPVGHGSSWTSSGLDSDCAMWMLRFRRGVDDGCGGHSAVTVRGP